MNANLVRAADHICQILRLKCTEFDFTGNFALICLLIVYFALSKSYINGYISAAYIDTHLTLHIFRSIILANKLVKDDAGKLNAKKFDTLTICILTVLLYNYIQRFIAIYYQS